MSGTLSRARTALGTPQGDGQRPRRTDDVQAVSVAPDAVQRHGWGIWSMPERTP